MSRTVAKLLPWVVLFLFTALYPVVLQAREYGSSHASTSLTGCVQKGDEPGGFIMVGADGKTWELLSSKVNLADHVGHKVTVTGHVEHQSKTHEEKMEMSEKKEANGKEYQDFEVSSLKMVSAACQ